MDSSNGDQLSMEPYKLWSHQRFVNAYSKDHSAYRSLYVLVKDACTTHYVATITGFTWLLISITL